MQQHIWGELEREFVNAPIGSSQSLGTFADAKNISLVSLQRYANKHRWLEKRSQFIEKAYLLEKNRAINPEISSDELDKNCLKLSQAFFNQVANQIKAATKQNALIEHKELVSYAKVVETMQKVAKLAIGESEDDFINRGLRYGYRIERIEANNRAEILSETERIKPVQLTLDTLLSTQ